MAAASARMVSTTNIPAFPFFPSSRGATRPPTRIRCRVTTPDTVRRYWVTVEADIDAHLAASIPTAPPPPVRDPMLRLVSSAPRTMAPVLCVAACELVGGRRDRALGAACALRLLHTAFHARRSHLGLSTPAGPRAGSADVAMGDGVKLQTADGLLALGYQLVAESDDGGEPGRVLRVLLEVTDAAGPKGMVEGQYEEVRYLQRREDGTPEAESLLERVSKKREGKLYACAAACGAILGGAGAEETEKLRRCGAYVGMLHGLLLYGGGGEWLADASGEKRAAVAGVLRSLSLSELEGFHGDMKEAMVGMVDARL